MSNLSLVLGGILSILASLLHIAIIFGGASWYRFFGAGEAMATMAEQGSWYPATVTLGISLVLFIWGMYAFSGAGIIRPLPFLKISLIIISTIYLLRGLAIIPGLYFMPDKINNFLLWSSIICIGYGLFYSIGTWQVWQKL